MATERRGTTEVAGASDEAAWGSTRATGQRIFYGWWIALAAMMIVFVGVGSGLYAPAVFLAVFHERFGWSRSAISLATTCYFLTSGLVGIAIGKWIDTHSTRGLFIASACLMAVALLALGRITQLWQLFPVYLLLAPGFTGLANIPTNALIARWFVRRRALALSIAMCGISLGGVVFTPLLVQVIERWSLRAATVMLAAILVVVVIPIALLVIRDQPGALGLGPDGDPPATPTTGTDAAPNADAGWSRSMAVRTRAFWLLVVAFGFGLAAQQAFLLHQISFLSGEIGAGAAATVLSATAGASIVGRLALGTVSDRLDKRLLAAGCFAAQGLAVVLVLHTGSLPLIYLYTLIFGLTMGNSYIMMSLLTAECFGVASFGAVYGLLSVFVMGGSAFGPWLVGLLSDASGGYLLPFTISGGTAVVMAFVVLFAHPPRRAVVP